jgi:hypothetical protein
LFSSSLLTSKWVHIIPRLITPKTKYRIFWGIRCCCIEASWPGTSWWGHQASGLQGKAWSLSSERQKTSSVFSCTFSREPYAI